MAQCLSGAAPCPVICDLCIQEEERYLRESREKAVKQAIALLTSLGYKITMPDPGYVAHLKNQMEEITSRLNEVPWGIQDEEALKLERAVLTERRTHLLEEYNRLTLR